MLYQSSIRIRIKSRIGSERKRKVFTNYKSNFFFPTVVQGESEKVVPIGQGMPGQLS